MNQIAIIILEKAIEAIPAILRHLKDEDVLEPADKPMDMSIPPAPGPSVVPGPPAEPKKEPGPVLPGPPEKKFIPPKGAIELDAEGIPWDARIHSGAKSKLAKKNTWKLLRGIDPVMVAKVKTELAQGVAASSGDAPPPAEVKPEVLDLPTMTWTDLMIKIAGASLDPAVQDLACQKYGVVDIGTLQDTPALVPLVAKDLGLT